MLTSELISHLRKFYSDTSRTKEETLEGLQELQSELEILIQTLEDEIDEQDNA